MHSTIKSISLRFVYGRVTDFINPEMAVQVYRFAQKWMILHLMKAAEDFLEFISPEDAIKILEHFVDEENNINLKCLDVRTILKSGRNLPVNNKKM
jgi:hypothetical protein